MIRLDGVAAFIRIITMTDANALHELRVRNRAFFTPYEPAGTDADWTIESVRGGIEAGQREQAEDRGTVFGIYARDDERLVGRIRMSNVFRGPWQNCTIGYYVDRGENGKGFCTDAVGLVCRYAFDVAKLHRVQAGVMTDNPRSMRVLEKNGFRREGIALRYLNINNAWRDHVIFAKTTED